MRDRLESLERLARLRESGLLTSDELEAEKRRILEEADAAVVSRSPDPFSRGLAAANAALRRRPWVFTAIVGGTIVTALLITVVLTGPELPGGPGKRTGQKEAPKGQPEAVMSRLATFDDLLAGSPVNCGFADSVIEGFMALDRPGAEGGGDAPFRLPDFNGPLELRRASLRAGDNGGEVRLLETATAGQWHGLRVLRLRVTTWPAGGPVAVQIRFQDRPQRVAERLSSIGFSFEPPGQLKSFQTGHQNYALGLEALGEGAALTCSRIRTRPS